MLRLLPGDPAQALAGPDATPQVVAALRHELGLDQPLPVQYLTWVSHAAHLDLGKSILSGQPVARLLGQRIPATMQLAAAALVLIIVFAIPTGVVAAVKQGSPMDWLISSWNGIAVAVPGFWLGILAIILFSLVLGWLPPGGMVDFRQDPALAFKTTILPASTLALFGSASLSRYVKAATLDVLYDDYVRAAWAKGLRGVTVVMRHVLRNALIPVITLLGLQIGALLGGSVITESVFAWPGLGRLMLDALGNRDYAVVQGGLLFLVLVYIGLNVAVDIAYGVVNPRIRMPASLR